MSRSHSQPDSRGMGEFLQAVYDGTDQLVYVFDADGDLLWWNEALRELSGQTDAELEESSAADLVEQLVVEEEQ